MNCLLLNNSIGWNDSKVSKISEGKIISFYICGGNGLQLRKGISGAKIELLKRLKACL